MRRATPPWLLTAAVLGLSLTMAGAAAPEPPSAVQASPLGTDKHVLRWYHQSGGAVGFRIERQNGDQWEVVANTLPSSSSYVDANGGSATMPVYRVSAYNNDGYSESVTAVSARMNVLFFLADDMGYKDIVANRDPAVDGPTIYETPALDTLKSQSVNFTQAYCSGPKCVVARRALQTGMYDFRSAAVAKNGGIGSELITIGEAMRAGGFRTGFIGKWHLGGVLDGSTPGGDEDFSSGGLAPYQSPVYKNWSALDPADNKYIPSTDPNHFEGNKAPAAQGYDVAIATGEWGAPPISYFANAPTGVPGEFWYGLPDLYSTDSAEYLTDRLTSEAIGFMNDAVTSHSNQPFFLTLAHYAVHTPLEAKADRIAYYEAKRAAMSEQFASHPAGAAQQVDFSSKVRMHQDQPIYAAMMESFDQSLASIRSYLAKTEDPRNPGKTLAETTIIIFSSDHGGKSTHWVNSSNQTPIPTSNYPLRQGKTWVYEGGLKIPLMVYWPGIADPGVEATGLVNGADFYTSILDMTGTPRVPAQHLDSISFAEAMLDPSRQLRSENPHWFTNADVGTGNPALGAFRSGDYKLVYNMIRRVPELYNLREDQGERNDIASLRPDLTGELLSRLIAARNAADARQPLPTSTSWSMELAVIAPVMAVPASAPNGVPADLAGVTVSDTAIDLSWTDASTDEERFVIQRKISGSGAFLEIATVPANTTRFRDTGLVPGTTYQYRVQAENLKGWAGPSNQITVGTSSSVALPIIARGDYITTLRNEVREFLPLDNDQGKGLSITSITQPAKGSATFTGRTIRFTPAISATGTDWLTYTVTDGQGAQATGLVKLVVLADHTVPAPLVYDFSPTRTDIDLWEFNDANGTRLDAAAKSAGASAFASSSTPTVQSDNLRFAQGGATGSIFRNASIASGPRALGATNSGVVEMSFRISSADLSGGANNPALPAYVGIGTRGKDATNALSDPLQIRLQENAGNLDLQARGASTSTCRTLPGLTLTQPLEVRVVLDLAAKTATVSSKLGTEAETTHGTYAFAVATTVWDTYRLASLNNSTDWGEADFVNVDYLRFRELTYPAPPSKLRMWVDAAEGSTAASADKLALADPDSDGMVNLEEYAFGGAPFSSSGPMALAAISPQTGQFLMTIPVLETAAFLPGEGGALTATAGGVTYIVSGSEDLQSFASSVSEVFPPDESALPPTPTGWIYRSFKLDSAPAAGRGFLRTSVRENP